MTEKTAKERVLEKRPHAFASETQHPFTLTYRYTVRDWPEQHEYDDTPRPLSGLYATEELAWQAAAAYLGCN